MPQYSDNAHFFIQSPFYTKGIGILICFAAFFNAKAQTIGTFNSVTPSNQTETLVLPSTHTFQRITKSGNLLSEGGTMGDNFDFTGYVPISGSSANGYLSISSELTPAQCAILEVTYNFYTHIWKVDNGGKVYLPFSDLGTTSRFCSGTVTPDNTIMVCEESFFTGDANNDGYEDVGWVTEIDPATKMVKDYDLDGKADRLWAIGRHSHENVAIKHDRSVIYTGADANPTGYFYKFVPTVAGNYTDGQLYVLKTTSTLGTGVWEPIPNTTKGERNNTIALSDAVGAYNFNGIEDTEIGPDGKVYFSAKGPGRVYRFVDEGLTVSNLEVFVESTDYDVDGNGPLQPEPWGIGNDNLAFDSEGNLWVLQDGSRNHIWVVGPAHTATTPDIRLFATTPLGSEPTGISFSPDYKFLFMSFQHPYLTNTLAQTDAAGEEIIFNTHTAIVIARKENLGPTGVLPPHFTAFDTRLVDRSVELTWAVGDIQNHDYFAIESSYDGVHFSTVYTNNETLDSTGDLTFKYIDTPAEGRKIVYYRIKECDTDGSCRLTETQSVALMSDNTIAPFPSPAHNIVKFIFASTAAKNVHISMYNTAGALVKEELQENIKTGANILTLNIGGLQSGQYIIVAEDGESRYRGNFIKI